MNNTELDDLALKLEDNLTTSALTIRATSEVVASCCATVNQRGEVRFALIPLHLMPERVAIITEEVRQHDAVLFVFVFDGFVTRFSATQPCERCEGAGCPDCRGSGKHIDSKTEAIHAVTRSAWGLWRQEITPYVVENGYVIEQVRERPDVVRNLVDPYAHVFSHKTVH